MAKAAPKRSQRSKKAAAVRKRGNKRAAKRTRKTTRARKTAAPHTTRKPATRPKPPALARERRTLTEDPAAPTAVAPEMATRNPEPEGARATRDSDEGREAEDGIDGQPTSRGTG
jgi:hypothetical protein